MKFDYNKRDIVDALRRLGLKKNDIVFVHSDLGLFGILQDAKNKLDYYYSFKDALLEVLGENGTLIVPTFSYSYCRNEVYDIDQTPSTLGFFSEMFRKDVKTKRSFDPNFSVAAQGKYSEFFTDYRSIYSFDGDCFWKRFMEKDGIFCNFNFSLYLTYIIYCEHQCGIPYRFDKPFKGITRVGDKNISSTYYHFVYDLNKPETEPDYNLFSIKAIEKGIAFETKLGRGRITRITSKNAMEFIRSELKDNPKFLIKGEQHN